MRRPRILTGPPYLFRIVQKQKVIHPKKLVIHYILFSRIYIVAQNELHNTKTKRKYNPN